MEGRRSRRHRYRGQRRSQPGLHPKIRPLWPRPLKGFWHRRRPLNPPQGSIGVAAFLFCVRKDQRPENDDMNGDRKSLRLKVLAATALLIGFGAAPASAEMLDVEKDELTFGFIKLTDMAPLAVAYERGYFEDEGLYVTLEPQANWKVLLDGVIDRSSWTAPTCSPGQPLAATIGFGTKAHIVTPLSMDLNGNGITVSNEVWEADEAAHSVPKMEDGRRQHPIKADYLKPVVEQFKAEGRPVQHGHGVPGVDPQLRAALLARRRRHSPGLLFTRATSPARSMAEALLVRDPAAADAGDPGGRHDLRLLRRRAVEPAGGVQGHRRAGDHRLRDLEEQSGEGLRHHRGRIRRAPTRTPRWRIVKAMIRAAKWLDENDNANRMEAVEILARPELCRRRRADVIANSMTGTFEYEKGDKREVPDFNVFFRYYATYPFYSDAVWYLTQMRRWGQIPEAQGPTAGTTRSRQGLSAGHLPPGRADAGRRGPHDGRRVPRLSLGHRRLP